MKFRIKEMTQFSGYGAKVYSVVMEDEQKSLFEKFILENLNAHKDEVTNIVNRIIAIGKNVGAQEYYFKHNEGIPGDGVCALYDVPDSNLRLYCIRYGNGALILGGGGFKIKTIRAYQEDAKLNREAGRMKSVSKIIRSKTSDKYSGVKWINGELVGNLNFQDDDNE